MTYRLDFRSDEQAQPSARSPWPSASVSRDTLRETISDFTGGRVSLDPPEAAR